jgi:hypothetical protein
LAAEGAPKLKPMSSDPVDLIRESPLGTRMTVRRRIDGGHTDAVGYLRERSDTECVVETRRGLVTISLADVTATRAVPPPPLRRAPRFPPLG